MSNSLPAKPSLEYLKKEAKKLLRSHRKRDPSAVGPLKLLPKFAKAAEPDILEAPLTLQEVQHALALGYGFANWRQLREGIEPNGRDIKMTAQSAAINREEIIKIFPSIVAEKAKEIAEANGGKPVRIMDILTAGGDGLHPRMVKKLIEEGIDFEFVFTDSGPIYLSHCYGRFLDWLDKEHLRKLKFAVVDRDDWRKEPKTVRVHKKYAGREISIEQLLADPDYGFMADGYENGRRKENFEDESFDLLIAIGRISVMYPKMEDAARESARMLRNGGYLITLDMELTKVKSYLRRAAYTVKNFAEKPGKILKPFETIGDTFDGISRAWHDRERTERVEKNLAMHLSPRSSLWSALEYRDHDDGMAVQTIQKGDLIKWHVAAYQKAVA